MLPKLQKTAGSIPIRLFRSLWGLESKTQSWAGLFARIKSQGFDGVEASLADIGWYHDRGQSFLRHLRSSHLSYILGLYTDWDDYEGSPTRHTHAQHAAQLQDQLGCALTLKSPAPIHINIHGGSDRLSVGTAASFFRDASALLNHLGIPSSRVSFETHRGRCLYSPWPTSLYLQQCPNLNLTLDMSHWVLVTESLLDSKEDKKWLQNEVIPRVRHVHARIGSPQQSQLPYFSLSKCTEDKGALYYETCRLRFEEIWKLCRRQGCVTFTVEYGPPPYAPFSTSNDFLTVLITAEANRLRQLLDVSLE
ncbi:hypothetical protein ABBQ32_002717 [Trebouxia sp. C0010 RCD-2024]